MLSLFIDLITGLGILCAMVGLLQVALGARLTDEPTRRRHPPAPLSELSTSV
jgi:hypothetical protein